MQCCPIRTNWLIKAEDFENSVQNLQHDGLRKWGDGTVEQSRKVPHRDPGQPWGNHRMELVRGFLYLGRTCRDRNALDSFGMIALSSLSLPTTYVFFKVKDDPEAAMNIKQAETMLGTLRWGQFNNYFFYVIWKPFPLCLKCEHCWTISHNFAQWQDV